MHGDKQSGKQSGMLYDLERSQGEEEVPVGLVCGPLDLCRLRCHRRDGWREGKVGHWSGAGPVMSELNLTIAQLEVPFTPGRKDKTAKECPAWDGPTCKEHCLWMCKSPRRSRVFFLFSLSLSVSFSRCAIGWPPAQRRHGQP